MASKNFTGYLRDPLTEYATNDLWRFTHLSTTGEVILGSQSLHKVDATGFYDIDIQYGNVVIESRDATSQRWMNHGVKTINSETIVTTLPALLLATTPVTPEIILQLEALLTDAETAAASAEASAIDAKESADSIILQAVALSLNTPLETVIYATNTTTQLWTVLYIHDEATQKTWAKPSSVGATETIVSVSASGLLTTDVMIYQLTIAKSNVITFESVAAMKIGAGLSSSALGAGGVRATVNGYYGGWAVLAKPTGKADYIITTLQKVRDTKANPIWVPDGYGDHYILGGTQYVAMLIIGADTNNYQFGTKGDNSTDDTLPLQAYAARNIAMKMLDGKYAIYDTIEVQSSLEGTGQNCEFKPKASINALSVRTGRSGQSQTGRVGNFAIDYQGAGTIDSNAVGMWLSKGTTPAGSSGNNNVTFHNIFVFKAYRGIQKLPTDLGNLWSVTFETIIIAGSYERALYIDTTGSMASLNVTFNNVTCDGSNSLTAKGAFIRGIANVKYFGTSTAITGGNLSAFWMSDCTNVDVRLQIENITVAGAISQGLIGFTNCHEVNLALTSQTNKFNVGAGNSAYYIYTNADVKAFIFESFGDAGNVVNSGTVKLLNLNGGVATNTLVSVIDPRINREDFYGATSVLDKIRFQNTNYALEKTSTTRRHAVRNMVVPVNVATPLLSTAAYDGVANLPSGMYIVQGRFSGDSGIGFTDLVMIVATGPSQQKAVSASSNFIGANHVRTYSIVSSQLAVSIAHTGGSYSVNATGIDQVGSL